MENPTVVHNTFVIERSLPQAPERVFAAFAEADKKRRWYAEGDHEIKEFAMEFREGGAERYSYRFREGHPIAGSEIANQGSYQIIEPGRRIVMTSKMSLNGKPITIMLGTLEFNPAGTGTELVLTHQAAYMEWPDGPGMIEAGWRSLIDKLAAALESQS